MKIRVFLIVVEAVVGSLLCCGLGILSVFPIFCIASFFSVFCINMYFFLMIKLIFTEEDLP